MPTPRKRIAPTVIPNADPLRPNPGAAEEDLSALPDGVKIIDFYGRRLHVKLPTVEQLAVWQRFGKRTAAMREVTGEDAARVVDQGMRIIESILATEDDRFWFEDQLLDGVLTLEETANIITLTLDAFKETGQVVAAANGPRPRARRR